MPKGPLNSVKSTQKIRQASGVKSEKSPEFASGQTRAVQGWLDMSLRVHVQQVREPHIWGLISGQFQALLFHSLFGALGDLWNQFWVIVGPFQLIDPNLENSHNNIIIILFNNNDLNFCNFACLNDEYQDIYNI